jgi:hypothetical protein
MIRNDSFAANRIMAAQALGVCGDPETSFHSIMKEATETAENYVFLQALSAFQYSQTDNRLTLDDWKRFKEKIFRLMMLQQILAIRTELLKMQLLCGLKEEKFTNLWIENLFLLF